MEKEYPKPCTKYIVALAVKEAEKDVRIPKEVRHLIKRKTNQKQ